MNVLGVYFSIFLYFFVLLNTITALDANNTTIWKKELDNFSYSYYESVESLIVNYSSSSRDDVQYQKPSILYVLPNNIGDLFGTIETLMEWKKRVGYEVNYVSSSNIVNNRNNLKEYIEES
mgnify:CR=1 FL=1